MERLRDHKGFTLIELAIVLVIIGIILGAVLKGQDLIQGARAKKFVTDAGKKFEMTAWTYFDKKGRFPGDGTNPADPNARNGIIGDDANDDPMSDLSAANFINPPNSPVTLGSYNFSVFLGNDGGAVGPPVVPAKNILVICASNDCTATFPADALDFLESFDTAIDGGSDGAAGQVVGINAAPGTVDNAKWLANYAATPAAAAWTANTTQALVYYFDRAR